jgi:hypothetical protein
MSDETTKLRDQLVGQARQQVTERFGNMGFGQAAVPGRVDAAFFLERMINSPPRQLEETELERANYLTPFSNFLNQELGGLPPESFDIVMDVLQQGMEEQIRKNRAQVEDIEATVEKLDTVARFANVPFKSGDMLLKGLSAGYIDFDTITGGNYSEIQEGLQSRMDIEFWEELRANNLGKSEEELQQLIAEEIENGDGPNLTFLERVIPNLAGIYGMLTPIGLAGRALGAATKGVAATGKTAKLVKNLMIGGTSISLYEGLSKKVEGDDRSRIRKAVEAFPVGVAGAAMGAAINAVYPKLHLPQWLADHRKMGVAAGRGARIGKIVDLPDRVQDAAFGAGLTALDPNADMELILENAVSFSLSRTGRGGRMERAAEKVLRQRKGGKVSRAAAEAKRFLDPEIVDLANQLERQQALVTLQASQKAKFQEVLAAANDVVTARSNAKSLTMDPIRAAEITNRAANLDPMMSDLPEPSAPREVTPQEIPLESRLQYPGRGWSNGKVDELGRMLDSYTDVLRTREDAVFQDAPEIAQAKTVESQLRGQIDQLLKIGMGGKELSALLRVDRKNPLWSRDPVMIRIRENFPWSDTQTPGYTHRADPAVLGSEVFARRLDMLQGEGDFSGSRPPFRSFNDLVSETALSVAKKVRVGIDEIARMELAGQDALPRLLLEFNPDATRRTGEKIGDTPETLREFVATRMRLEMEQIGKNMHGTPVLADPGTPKPGPPARRSIEELSQNPNVEVNPKDPVVRHRIMSDVVNVMRKTGDIALWPEFRKGLDETVLWDALQPGGSLDVPKGREQWVIPAIQIWERNLARQIFGLEFDQLPAHRRPGRSTMEIAKVLYEQKAGAGAWGRMKADEAVLAQDRGEAPDSGKIMSRRSAMARAVDRQTRGLIHQLAENSKAQNALAKFGIGVGKAEPVQTAIDRLAATLAVGTAVGLGATGVPGAGELSLAAVPAFMSPLNLKGGKDLIVTKGQEHTLKQKLTGFYRNLTSLGENTVPTDIRDLKPGETGFLRNAWWQTFGHPRAVVSDRPVSVIVEGKLRTRARLESMKNRLFGKTNDLSKLSKEGNELLAKWLDGFRTMNKGEPVTDPAVRRSIVKDLSKSFTKKERTAVQKAYHEVRGILDGLRVEVEKLTGREMSNWGIVEDFFPHIYPPEESVAGSLPAACHRAMDSALAIFKKKSPKSEAPFDSGVELAGHLLRRQTETGEAIMDADTAMRAYLPEVIRWIEDKKIANKLAPLIQGRKRGVKDISDAGLEQLLRVHAKAGKTTTEYAIVYEGKNYELTERPYRVGDEVVRVRPMGEEGAKSEPIPLAEFKAKAKVNQGGIAQLGSRNRLDYAEEFAEAAVGNEPFVRWGKQANAISKYFYELNLTSLNPKASINNLLGGEIMNFNELGVHYSAVSAKQALDAYLRKDPAIRKILEESGVMADGMWMFDVDPEFSLMGTTAKKMSQANMFVFMKTEMFNRARGYLGGRQRALDYMDNFEVRPEWARIMKEDGVPVDDWVKTIAHREGVQTIGRTSALYSVANAPRAFRSNPVLRLALHLNRFTFAALNDTIRTVQEAPQRPQKLMRQIAGIFIMREIGESLGLDFNFLFHTEAQDIGGAFGVPEAGDVIPEMRGQDDDEGSLWDRIGSFPLPFQLPWGPSAPVTVGSGLADLMISTFFGPDSKMENVAEWRGRASNRIMDQLIPFYKVHRMWSRFAAGVTGDPEKGFQLEASDDPEAPFKVLNARGETMYLTDAEALTLAPFFGSSETRDVIRAAKYEKVTRARETQTRARKRRAVEELVDAWKATGDENYRVQALEIMREEAFDPGDIETSMKHKDDPSWIWRDRGTNRNFLNTVYRRWKNKLATKKEILRALTTIRDTSSFQDEHHLKVFEMLEDVREK